MDMNYTPKPLEEYIKKHGEEKGLRVWKAECKKAEKYNNQPYKRLTKEWFLWRYGEEIGIEKFNNHVNKSRQSLDNFIKRYGPELGLKKYQETVKKKDTVSIVRELENGDDIVKERYEKAKASTKIFLDSLSEEEKKERTENAKIKRKLTKEEKYGGQSVFHVIKTKNPENWEDLYSEYKRKIFRGGFNLRSSKECEMFIRKIFKEVPECIPYCSYGFDDSKEKKISSKFGTFSLDFIFEFADQKIVIEYDGALFHPSKEQYEKYPDQKMPIGSMTYKEKYERDQKRNDAILDMGAKLFIIRSDESDLMKKSKIELIVKEIKNVLLN